MLNTMHTSSRKSGLLNIFLLLCSFLLFTSIPANSAANTTTKLNELTIKSLHIKLTNKEMSCAQVIQFYVRRINEYDKPTKLNAIILLNKQASVKAKILDREFAKTQKLRSLHCVPIILKDNFDTADMPTTAGSSVLANSIPPDDAFIVKKLRAAGAIIIAKSNMAEWAFSPYQTISSTFGVTANAYDLSRVPAGSSGGTASAIAANFALVGMGTDTGNSIRGPASHLALVGIRPTLGLTSRDGIVPLLLNRDIAGPLTRTVTDAALILDVISGYDSQDRLTKNYYHKNPQPSYFSALNTINISKLRIGILRELFSNAQDDPEIMALMEKAIIDLRQQGFIILDPFSIDKLAELAKATGFCSRFRYDINHYFASLGANAPVSRLQDIVSSQQFLPGNKGAMKWATSIKRGISPAQQSPPCTDVNNDPRRKNLLDAVLTAMDKHQIDAIAYPSWNNPPRKLNDLASPHGNNSPIIAPHTGQPAITVPMGFTQAGLPAGIQFLARPFAEHILFKIAYTYEQATQHRKEPQGYP